MTKIKWGAVGALLLLVALMWATGCSIDTLDVGELQADSTTIELGSADDVAVDIMMGAGQLIIGGGNDELLDAQFTYNVAELEPEVSYEISDGRGRLTVNQPDTRESLSWDLDEFRYEWDLRLNDDVPMDMAITVGAGESQLALGSLSLDRLDFESGAGDVEIDLNGSTVRNLNVRLGAGDVRLDLSGNWRQDLSATIKGGVGRATVILPSTAGVQATIQGGLGSVNADGLNRDGDVYTNDVYGQSDVTLDINIEGGIGEINLVYAE
jgi:hypothetical protein